MLVRVPIDVNAYAGARARWLGELSKVLGEARALLSSLAASDPAAMDLSLRIASAQAQVCALQLGRPTNDADKSDPNWTGSLPWPYKSDPD
jgi:hypothetical protein